MDKSLQEKIIAIKVNELKSENNTAKQIIQGNENTLQKVMLSLTVINTVGIGLLFFLI